MNIEQRTHPDSAYLADYYAGKLGPEDNRQIEEHLQRCPLCRLEMLRIERFMNIEEDAELAEKSGWNRVEKELDGRFQKRVLPTVAPGASKREPDVGPSRFTRWLVPLAAAAVLAVIFFQIEDQGGRVDITDEAMRMRGTGMEAELITPQSPVGDVGGGAISFSWKTEKDFDYYDLEIFTPELESVYLLEEIRGDGVILPDSARSRIENGVIYLWNVKGFSSLDKTVVSRNVWFRVGGPDDE